MKQGLTKNTEQKKEFKYDLTIGMIFRDDIKYIRKCLETLQPLREACHCQLIMTDTGSADGSRDVAEEYADILLDFEWCDDFSAARNTAVELAEGRWFLFIDCDEHFDESVLEIATFLNTEESYKVDHVIFTIHNYNEDGNYDDFQLQSTVRLFNFQEKQRNFDGKVHESIPRKAGFKYLSCTIHHWGYTKLLLQKKLKRNSATIAKLIEEEPDNLKNWQQYVLETSDAVLAIERAKKAIEIADGVQNFNRGAYQVSLRLLAYINFLEIHYWHESDILEFELLDLFPKCTDIDLFEQEYYYFSTVKQIVYLKNNQSSQALVDNLINTFQIYTEKYLKEQENPDLGNSSMFPFKSNNERNFHELELSLLRFMYKFEYNQFALPVMEQSNMYLYQRQNGEYPFLPWFVAMALQEKIYSITTKIYNFLLDTSNEVELSKFKNTVEISYNKLEDESDKEALLKALSQNVVDDYTAVLSLRKKKFTERAYTKAVCKYISEEEDFQLNPLNAHLLYGFMLTRIDPLGYVAKNDVAFMVGQFGRLVASHSDFIELIETTYADPNFVISSIKEQKLWAYLGMRACLHLAKDGAEEDSDETTSEATDEATDEATSETTSTSVDVKRVNRLYSQAVPLMYDYACKAYNPALLGEEGKGVVAQEELFAVYAMEAMQAESPMAMVRKLKEAMEVCPSYGPIIKLFLGEM